MRSTSAYYKQKIASGATRNFEVLIYLNLTDNTQLTITNAEITENSFKLMSASSGTESFDIGSAIIGKCTFTLNNFEDDFTDYDFFNATATVWLKLDGDSSYHRMGFYTVDEPTKANSLIQLELLDNMWKFDKDLPTIAYPDTVGNIVYSLCQHCSVALTTVSFNGSSYTIQAAPEQDMNCREYLQYLAMVGCNFCVMDDQGGLCLKWYDMTSYDDPTHGSVVAFDKLFSRNVGTAPITVTGIKVRINEQDYLMGNEGYVLVLENPLINEDNVSAILSLIWNRLHPDNQTYFEFTTYNVTMLPDLTPEVGDCVSVTAKDGTPIYSYLTNFTFTPSLCTPSLGAVTPQRSLTRRTSKAVQAAVEVARERVQQEIGYYDVGVQRMNELAINAMGGYTDYDEPATGGRIYYLSNAPITKNAQTGQCEFDDNAVVYKTSGDGFFISTSVDPQTHQRIWTQGYSPSTGLLVEMLTALRINAEQMYTGQMTVGGSQTGVTKPYIRVLDTSNNVVCTINHLGIIMGSGYIASSDFEDKTPVDVFSLHGMKIDVNGKYIKSPHFGFNENGAYFDGEINVYNHPITVRGDIELYNGSGTSFDFAPYDYRLSEDFVLTFYNENEAMTVTINQYRHTSTTPTLIETVSVPADTETSSTVLLDHLVGQDDGDFYRITATATGTWTATIDDAILAYMGTGGFRGFMQGIFEGYLNSKTGRIGNMKYGDHSLTVGNDDLILYGSSSDKYLEISLSDPDAPQITRHYISGNDTVSQDVAWGRKQNFIGTDVLPLTQSGETGDLIITLHEYRGGRDELWRWDGSSWGEVDLSGTWAFLSDSAPANSDGKQGDILLKYDSDSSILGGNIEKLYYNTGAQQNPWSEFNFGGGGGAGSYYTSEHKTDMRWITGSPIYTRTYWKHEETTSSTVGWITNQMPPSAGMLIKSEGFMECEDTLHHDIFELGVNPNGGEMHSFQDLKTGEWGMQWSGVPDYGGTYKYTAYWTAYYLKTAPVYSFEYEYQVGQSYSIHKTNVSVSDFLSSFINAFMELNSGDQTGVVSIIADEANNIIDYIVEHLASGHNSIAIMAEWNLGYPKASFYVRASGTESPQTKTITGTSYVGKYEYYTIDYGFNSGTLSQISVDVFANFPIAYGNISSEVRTIGFKPTANQDGIHYALEATNWGITFPT